jgi:hypothetical protein
VIPAPVGSGGGTGSGAVIPAPVGSGGGAGSGAVIPVPIGSGGNGKAPANIQPTPMEGANSSNAVVFNLGTHNKDEGKPFLKATTNPKKLLEERTDKGSQEKHLKQEEGRRSCRCHTEAPETVSFPLLATEGAVAASAKAPEPVFFPLLAPCPLTDGGHAENSLISEVGCQTNDSELNEMLNDVQTEMQEHMNEGDCSSSTAGAGSKMHKNLFQTIQMCEFRLFRIYRVSPVIK